MILENILTDETSVIAAQINKVTSDVAKFNLAASLIGLLPIDFLYDRAVNLPVDDRRVYDVRKKSRYTNYYTLFENASYFDKLKNASAIVSIQKKETEAEIEANKKKKAPRNVSKGLIVV